VQTKNSGDIGVGEIGIPRKGVGYFVRVAWNLFACELGFRPDQYLCQFSRYGEMGRVRVVETALLHSAVGCCAVRLGPDAGELGEISLQLIDP
jgi:hypothetical protein